MNDFHAPKVMVTCVEVHAAYATAEGDDAPFRPCRHEERLITTVNVDASPGTATARRWPQAFFRALTFSVRGIRSQAILAFSQAPRWYVARAT